jgi:hypothetical protein
MARFADEGRSPIITPCFVIGDSLSAILSLAVDFGPILKLIGVEFSVEISYALLHTGLRVYDSLVVNRWPNFFNEEVEQ